MSGRAMSSTNRPWPRISGLVLQARNIAPEDARVGKAFGGHGALPASRNARAAAIAAATMLS